MTNSTWSNDRNPLSADHFRTTNMVSDAHRALQQAVDFSLNCQQPDGHWVAPVSADATFTAQYVMFKFAYSSPGLCLSEPESDAIRRWLLSDQRTDGGWALAPDLPGNVSTSVEAYLALRLLGTPRSHPDMKRAADFILSQGGVASVRFFTRFFLATYGLVPWEAIPQMPAELILLPSWAKLNIYVLSSWARSTLIPILVVRHHEPVYSLPIDEDKPRHDEKSGQSNNTCSGFIDELWIDPSNKNVSLSRSLWDCFLGPEEHRDVVEGLFTAADNILSQGWISNRMNNGKNPIRKLALKRCMDWILDHQEASGDWAGFFPPIHGGVWALLLQGYPVHHKSVRLGLEALERLTVHDSRGKWVQSTISACWDTALVVNALCDAQMAMSPEPDRHGPTAVEMGNSTVRLHKPLSKAAAWLRNMQLMVDHGDWRIYANTQQAGGWSFEYYNSFYPDVDDTAVVIMTLVKEDPHAIHSKCIANAVEWILGMQNHDGGWGAFDINNDARWLHKIPFSDMDSLVDPSTADVTGRMLECFGFLLDHRREHQHLALDSEMRRRLLEASKPALKFLLATQDGSGAWWGRWGNNYNYGTTNVLRGLANGNFWRTSPAVHEATLRAIRWLLNCQNADGGWGETLLSYAAPAKAGRGESTAAQTAWALDSLLRFYPASDTACQRGLKWLIKNQSETPASRTGAYSITPQEPGQEDGTFRIKLHQRPEDCSGASWPISRYVGTGFPKVLYLGYPFYHHVFPIQALSRYVDCMSRQSWTATTTDDLLVKSTISIELNRPHALLMALGSRGDIDVFLSIAQRLRSSCRVRIATHVAHQARVEEHGFEFYDVGGSPNEYASVLGNTPAGVVTSNIKQLVKGELRLAALRRSLCTTFELFWRSCFDDSTILTFQGVEKAPREGVLTSHHRPFLADIVVSGPATKVHMHACEGLQIPLVLVSPQPNVPTNDFPDVLTMSKPTYVTGSWWNRASYFIMDLLNWLAFGSFLNQLRVDKYKMHPVPWSSALRGAIDHIPHICLWSSNLVQRPSEWPRNVVMGGYTSLLPKPGRVGYLEYRLGDPLHDFISSHDQEVDRGPAAWNNQTPLIVFSFGSMSIPSPAELLSLLSSALERVDARAVVCVNWDIACGKEEIHGGAHNRIYLTDQSVPHAWLLRHATGGFVHHGGAGHTAAGLRAGVPMLLLPFMLDQHFWASQIHKLGLGPPPVPFHHLTADKLVESLGLLIDGSKSGKESYGFTCAKIAERVRTERDGADVAAEVILQQLGLPSATGAISDESRTYMVASPTGPGASSSRIHCNVLPELVGPWRHKTTGVPLSGAAAACLVSESVLNWDDLEIRPSVGEGYWSRREESMTAWVQAVSRVTACISCAAGILWVLLTCLIRLELAQMGFRGRSLRSRGQISDVSHSACIEQAKYDLEFFLEHSASCGESPPKSGHGSHVVIRRGIVRKWNATVAAKHHTEFLVE